MLPYLQILAENHQIHKLKETKRAPTYPVALFIIAAKSLTLCIWMVKWWFYIYKHNIIGLVISLLFIFTWLNDLYDIWDKN